MCQPLERVADQLVTERNPPRYDIDGMDSTRCIALHNAILEHAFVSSGRTTEDFMTDTRTWWDVYGDVIEANRLHSSMQTFLKDARVVPFGHEPETSFFYNVGGLQGPKGFWYGATSTMFEDANLVITLYFSQEPLASTPDGLLYEQFSHKAMKHFDVEDDVDLEFENWVNLESILTVWIEMIQREKIVALPADVGVERWEIGPDDGYYSIQGPEKDPNTGAMRLHYRPSPWTAQAWVLSDLEDSLNTWTMIVEAIEQKMGLDFNSHPSSGLYDLETLVAAQIPEGFARQFLLKARKPQFKHIAPGLRISDSAEFTHQPGIELNSRAPYPNPHSEQDGVPPILLFRNDRTVSTLDLDLEYPYSGPQALVKDWTCGLWLSTCHRRDRIPFEDGFSLILPFHFKSGWAKHSDMSPVSRPAGLLQHGVNNPYNDFHSPQLRAYLDIVLRNVQKGIWEVDEDGVAGGIDVWKEADTEERWMHYWVAVGPGWYW